MNLFIVFSGIIAPALAAIAMMFLPAIIELKRPRDAGPRKIGISVYPKMSLLAALIDVEEIENKVSAAFPLPSLLYNMEA